MSEVAEATQTVTKVTRTKRAVDTPVHKPADEVHTSDFAVGQRPPIVLPGSGPIAREAEEIAVIDTPLHDDYAEALAFMEEEIKIILTPTSAKFAPRYIDVYVNGRAEWIPVGKPWSVKRKYVEVLARTKPMDVQTQHENATVEMPNNQILRFTRVEHPFSVIEDKNPRGHEWLARLLAEG